MKHLLMDPAFPDLVGAWAEDQAAPPADNDNRERREADGVSDPLLDLFGRLEIAATRVW